MKFFRPIKTIQKTKVLEEKEISKGALGFVTRNSNATIFTFFKSNIDKRKKLKDEMNSIINSYKEHPIKEGILKINSINNSNTTYTIITEPIIDSLSNLHAMKFKGFEIYKMFIKFNTFIKYCLDKKINLGNLKLSDIYLTKNNELKILSINYDTEILHKIKKEKYGDNCHNNNKYSISYLIGVIMYYLYYNEIPKNNETKFPEPKHFNELLKYCLNSSTKFDFNEYINKTFFHPDIIFPNNIKNNTIKLIEKYKEYKPNKGNMSPDCEELYFVLKKVKIVDCIYDYDYIYLIYNSFDKSKIFEEKSRSEPELFKLKTEKNNNLYAIAFDNKIAILKKNSNDTFSIKQEIKIDLYKYLLELSNGDLAVINGYPFRKIIIYNKNNEDKFDIKLIINDFNAKFIFETSDNYLSIMGYKQSALYDIKSFNKIKESKDSKEIYLNEKIKIRKNISGTGIYHEFFEEDIDNFKSENILCVTLKKDGTYLLGGYYNYIYKICFDKYGFVELISKIDTDYGYYEDNLSGDCFYSIPDSRYYSVRFINECDNGNILTISDYADIKKMWKY